MRLKITGQLIISISFCCLFQVQQAKGQSVSTFDAALHFQQSDQIDEGLLFLENPVRFGFKTLGKDTSKYLMGKLHYHKKNITQSINFLTSVSNQSVFFEESVLLSSYQYAYFGQLNEAKHLLANDASILNRGVNLSSGLFLLSGISLLERDFETYERLSKLDQNSSYRELSNAKKKFSTLQQTILEQKSKSPLLAGIMSTLVPGLGHMYVGNIGRGAMTLVTTGIFGLQAWESYQKDGLKSARFVIFGALFSSFYIANIYGSSIGVRLHKQQINDQINESILVTMHVPLRYLFD